MTTGKTITLTIQTFVSKVKVLLFNMLSRLVIAFLPRSKRLLIAQLQSPSAVILEPKKRKSVTISTVSPSICHKVMGLDAMIFVFWMLSFKAAFSFSSFTFIENLPAKAGTQVPSLVQENPTCHRAAKFPCYNCGACSRAGELQLLSPRAAAPEARAPKAQEPQEKPPQWEDCARQWRVAPAHHN